MSAAETSDEDVKVEPDGPDLPVAKVTEQFPAKAGTEEGRAEEVEQRSADGAAGDRYVKEFVTEPGAQHNAAMHEANKAAVLQEAIQRGLHPRGEVRFDGAEEQTSESGSRVFKHAVLTYSVRVVPASVDTQPGETTTPRDQVESDGGDTAKPKATPAAKRPSATTKKTTPKG